LVLAGSPITFSSAVTLPGTIALSVNTTTTLSGVLSGTGSLLLQGSEVAGGAAGLAGNGNLVLTAADTFTGPLTVNAGTLTLSGSGALTAVAGVSAVQTLTFGPAVSGGTFTLAFNGATTAPITWSSTPATLVGNIQAALDALPTIGAGNTLVAGTGP